MPPSTSLLPEVRQNSILRLLQARGSASITELEQELGVSGMTVRRDLRALEQRGIARRTYGGAMLAEPAPTEGSFDHRLSEFVDAKERAAQATVELIADGEMVFVDSSTSALHVARALVAAGRKVTVVTNSLPVQNVISEGSAAELVALGGRYDPYGRCFLGPDTVRAIRTLLADKAVLSGPPALGHGQLYYPDPLDAEVKRAMIEQAAESLLLFSSTILPRRGLTAVAPLSSFAHFITTEISDAEAKEVAALGPSVLRV
jgi:DeoR/GlpR family transcriptional regulator of sugar metabolism